MGVTGIPAPGRGIGQDWFSLRQDAGTVRLLVRKEHNIDKYGRIYFRWVVAERFRCEFGATLSMTLHFLLQYICTGSGRRGLHVCPKTKTPFPSR